MNNTKHTHVADARMLPPVCVICRKVVTVEEATTREQLRSAQTRRGRRAPVLAARFRF